ncbi:MAG TPA: hypothetical protein VFO39_05010 [Candidatus Sulfotelmatobacter sp.]|nr:hypothetical protein [Candidatus Sulfotelmatobacter sp.]
MNLAKVLALCFFLLVGAPLCVSQDATPSRQAPSPAQNQPSEKPKTRTSAPRSKSHKPKASAQSTTKGKDPKGKKKSTAKHATAAKKTPPNIVDCEPTAANAASSAETPAGGSPTTKQPATNSGAPSAASSGSTDPVGTGASKGEQATTNCPPSKTIIRQGSTTDPGIQLVGGAGGRQASDQKATTDQLLTSTQDNLNKVAGKSLNSGQQEMITQIQQFMEQSKAAIVAGDTERGRTLAMKAHLLSDELVKP